MTTETIARARWRQTDTYDHYLVARAQDGGNVLATVKLRREWAFAIGGYTWSAAGKSGIAETIDTAMRAARAALREASDAESA